MMSEPPLPDVPPERRSYPKGVARRQEILDRAIEVFAKGGARSARACEPSRKKSGLRMAHSLTTSVRWRNYSSRSTENPNCG